MQDIRNKLVANSNLKITFGKVVRKDEIGTKITFLEIVI